MNGVFGEIAALAISETKKTVFLSLAFPEIGRFLSPKPNQQMKCKPSTGRRSRYWLRWWSRSGSEGGWGGGRIASFNDID